MAATNDETIYCPVCNSTGQVQPVLVECERVERVTALDGAAVPEGETLLRFRCPRCRFVEIDAVPAGGR